MCSTCEPFAWPGSPYAEFSFALGTADTVTGGATRLVVAADGTLISPDHLCPDLLHHGNIGAADGWRGRLVLSLIHI